MKRLNVFTSTSKISQLFGTVLFLAVLTSKLQAHVLDEVPLVDGHNDLPYNLYKLLKNNLKDFQFDNDLSNDPVWGSKYCSSCYTDLPRLRAGKVGAQFWVAYVDCKIQYRDALAKTVEQIDVIKRLVMKYPKDLQLVTSADGIMEAFRHSPRKIASLIAVEGGHSMDSRLGVLRMLYDLGVRYMTLTHSCNTPWADNSYVDDSKPVHNLTEFGRTVVREMNRLGMLVDLSHVSHNVMNQAIEASKAPIIFSHSSAYSVKKHNRNVPDDTLKLVKENKGIVMVNFYSGFVNDNASKATIDDVIAHINHVVDIAGIESVGVGGDYDGVSSMPKGLEDVSKYPGLFDRLQTKNPTRWTNENLKKLAGENFLRVFKAVEKVRDDSALEQPNQQWIPEKDLNAVEDETLWMCRTLLNNTSPWKPKDDEEDVKDNGNIMLKTTSLFVLLAVLITSLI